MGAPQLLSTNLEGADSSIEVIVDEPIGVISPNIYGQFVENLSGVVYDGIWVGRSSKIPNENGIRRDLLDGLRQIRVPVIRFPGGCFADSYDWRDGVGPMTKRPRRTNFLGIGRARDSSARSQYDPNLFGTNEFVWFCQFVGAQPYLAANVRSLPALEFQAWIEYCNSPSNATTLGELRAQNGSVDPFAVRYWGVGNEAWGCGGEFTAEEYAGNFRRYTAFAPTYGSRLSFVASGANKDDWSWTQRF